MDLKIWRDELLDCVRKGKGITRPFQTFALQPVLIVAGSCREESGEGWDRFVRQLDKSLDCFQGRVISGGTRVGVCGEVGRISAERPRSERGWTSVGYLPRRTPAGLVDERYDELIFTTGLTFSEIEPLQYWTDILASGICPGDVTLWRYGGGIISDFEERLAMEIGAKSGFQDGQIQK